jgi:hypothetical protein
MSKDTMEVLVQVQNVALDPDTTEETLRDMLIGTLEIVESDIRVAASMKKLISTHEVMIEQLEERIYTLEALLTS